MNAIVRPVLTGEDVFVANENEIPHTRGIIEYQAQEHPEVRPGDEARKSSDTEPYGMYWHREGTRSPVLRAHEWFYLQVATTAEQVLAAGMKECKDPASQQQINDMAAALREYIQCRTAINHMAGERKLKGEADDACYQLAQAAKYFIDATQAAQKCIDSGFNIDDNKRINALKERSTVAMCEGYMIAQAVLRAADRPPNFDLRLASRRVVDYSCRKLTEWFAARREHEAHRDEHRATGAALDLERFLQR